MANSKPVRAYTHSGAYTIVKFTYQTGDSCTDTWTPPPGVSQVQVLVIAGGGGGGGRDGEDRKSVV